MKPFTELVVAMSAHPNVLLRGAAEGLTDSELRYLYTELTLANKPLHLISFTEELCKVNKLIRIREALIANVDEDQPLPSILARVLHPGWCTKTEMAMLIRQGVISANQLNELKQFICDKVEYEPLCRLLVGADVVLTIPRRPHVA